MSSQRYGATKRHKTGQKPRTFFQKTRKTAMYFCFQSHGRASFPFSSGWSMQRGIWHRRGWEGGRCAVTIRCWRRRRRSNKTTILEGGGLLAPPPPRRGGGVETPINHHGSFLSLSLSRSLALSLSLSSSLSHQRRGGGGGGGGGGGLSL